MRLAWLAALAGLSALVATADLAAAQSGAAQSGTARSRAQAPAATPAATTRTARPRSAAQLRNDQIMRDCGAEWRANKPRLQAAGKTWRTFLPECRARRVAATPSR